MTELTWTKQTPTEPGWYWWRIKGYKPTVLRVDFGRDGVLHAMCDAVPVTHPKAGEWAGPIPAPQEPK